MDSFREGKNDDDDDDDDDDDERGSEGRSCIQLTNHCSRGRFLFMDLFGDAGISWWKSQSISCFIPITPPKKR